MANRIPVDHSTTEAPTGQVRKLLAGRLTKNAQISHDIAPVIVRKADEPLANFDYTTNNNTLEIHYAVIRNGELTGRMRTAILYPMSEYHLKGTPQSIKGKLLGHTFQKNEFGLVIDQKDPRENRTLRTIISQARSNVELRGGLSDTPNYKLVGAFNDIIKELSGIDDSKLNPTLKKPLLIPISSPDDLHDVHAGIKKRALSMIQFPIKNRSISVGDYMQARR
jgi:hypothetical protein